jgi:hypothetical protein
MFLFHIPANSVLNQNWKMYTIMILLMSFPRIIHYVTCNLSFDKRFSNSKQMCALQKPPTLFNENPSEEFVSRSAIKP